MSKRALICDDSVLMRKLVGETLIETGWEVIGEAADGNQAIVKPFMPDPLQATLDRCVKPASDLAP